MSMAIGSKIIRIVNLNDYTTEESLQQFLLMVCVSGKIENIFIRKDEVLNLVYAYVIFQHDSDAKTVVSCLNGLSYGNNIIEVELIGPKLSYKRFKHTACFDIQNNEYKSSFPKVFSHIIKPTTLIASATKVRPATAINPVQKLMGNTSTTSTSSLHSTFAIPSTSTIKSVVPLASMNQVLASYQPTNLKTTTNIAPQTLTSGRKLHYISAIPYASTTKSDVLSASTTKSAVPSASTIKSTLPSITKYAVPSASTTKYAVSSASTTKYAVSSASTTKSALTSASTIKAAIPSASSTKSDVPSASVKKVPFLCQPTSRVTSVTATSTASETRRTSVSGPRPISRSETPGHPLNSTSSFKGTSTSAQFQKNIHFQTVQRKSQIGKEVKQCIIS